MSYNKVILIGNLTRDPETRSTQSGTSVANFGVAVTEKYKDQETTTFVDVTMFGKRGEAFAKFHSKGDRVFVDGKLRLDTWDDKNTGTKRSKLYVVGESFEFVKSDRAGGSSRPSGGGGGESTGSSDPWGVPPGMVEDTPF